MTDLIKPEDLKIEQWPPHKFGGQQAGGFPPGIKITHIPTATEAVCISARSQSRNREVAMSMIECALTHPRS